MDMLDGQFLEKNFTEFSPSNNSHHVGFANSRSLKVAIPFSILSGTFSLLGGISNLFLMIVLIRYVQISQKTYLYMFSLFLSDFLYNVVFQPQVVYYQFPSVARTDAGINFLLFCMLTFLQSGVWNLFLATLDKYMFINYPYVYASHVSQTKTLIVVVAMWLLCIFFGILSMFGHFEVHSFCLWILVVLFLLTFLLQILIFAVARKQLRKIQLINRMLDNNPRHLPSMDGPFSTRRAALRPNKAARLSVLC